jgi:hypothetical protein
MKMTKEFMIMAIGMFYGMGIMLVAVNLGFFPICGPSLITGVVSMGTAIIAYNFRDIVYQKLGEIE